MPPTTVPAALRAELTEYTCLLRALRTRRTLDLTSHLLRHAQQENKPKADTWTSWPLIDCAVPEWTFEDEIRQLADTVLRQHAQATRARGDYVASESESESDRQSEEELRPAAAKDLVLRAGALLVRILNLIADQRPSAPGSMQNRLSPMNWEDVISLLAVHGDLDPAILTRAEERLKRIYGPSNTKAMERITVAAQAKARFTTLLTALEDQLLAPPVLHPRPVRRSDQDHQSNRRKIKSRAVIDSDTDIDTRQRISHS